MGAFKPSHIIVLLIILIIVFGASKLPEIAKNLGKSAKVLKKEMKELTDEEQPSTKPSDSVEEDK
ncbi:twin-arginine translocase TatA/TatE family subunit [Actinomyces sp. HMSC065F11]|uniref:twin-arginine translocase TatA/TatE family subunit n=1 Tax=Actinomyces sp. HMSC065F11 TaxID=1739395 RepID=UPI0008A4402F|nr:twin-arginine translocase TatA/TatE family subunit [Actinomyces sp. HMSC065F11]OFR32236.1 preprotein translocase [Actinomyces sp. HMSC065F11]